MQSKTLIPILFLGALAYGPALLAAEKPAAKETPKAEATKVPTAAPTAVATAAPSPTATVVAKGADAKKDEKAASSEAGHKSPALAGTLAFIPGIAIHGVGHMYAGSWIKGLGLLAVEGASAGLVAYQGMTGYDDIQKLFDKSNGAIPNDITAGTSRIGIILVGTMAFMWSWWDDMAGAPIAAGEYNKRADQEAARAQLNVAPTDGGVQVAYSLKF